MYAFIMAEQLLADSYILADDTSTPVPTPTGVSADQVSPGFLGFLATFFVVVVMAFLIVDMVRRIRKVRYRAKVSGELEEDPPGDSLPEAPEDHSDSAQATN